MKLSSTSSFAMLFALCVASSALAGQKPTPPPAGDVNGEQWQRQTAAADAAAAAAATAEGGDATGVGIGTGIGVGGNGGDSGGNTLSTAYESRDRALAFALPGQTGAPAVAGECLEHLRGGSGASIGVSGRTRINRECMEFQQCIALADRYASWGQFQLAVEQLEKCGGVKGAVIAAPPAVVESTNTAFVTRDEFEQRLERAYSDLLLK